MVAMCYLSSLCYKCYPNGNLLGSPNERDLFRQVWGMPIVPARGGASVGGLPTLPQKTNTHIQNQNKTNATKQNT